MFKGFQFGRFHFLSRNTYIVELFCTSSACKIIFHHMYRDVILVGRKSVIVCLVIYSANYVGPGVCCQTGDQH